MIFSDDIAQTYRRRFGRAPRWIARAPGRVNLIGEHTDYNDGLVLPFAIDESLYVAAGPGRADTITVHSCARGQTVTFPTGVSAPARSRLWQNYVRGVVCALARAEVPITGVNLCIDGDLPEGSGLSSSAALSVGCALALSRMAGVELTSRELALLGRGVEHEFAGTMAGIMDPYVCAFGRAGHALLIDCRTETHEYVPLNLRDARLLLIDSGVKHDLAAGAYRERVLECRRAAAVLAAVEPAVRSLRDVTCEMLKKHRDRLDEVLVRRAEHVVRENQRVRYTVEALSDGSIDWLGEWLRDSHMSLSHDYDVSCSEIEEIIDILDHEINVLGARMIGGGFGGMVLALVHEADEYDIAGLLDATYNMRHPRPVTVTEVVSANGAECLAV